MDEQPRLALYYPQDWEDLQKYLKEKRMKEDIKLLAPATEYIKSKYTCSRCGKPCGSDEPSRFYDIKEAVIAVNSTRKVMLRLAPDLEPSIFVGITSTVEIAFEEGTSYPECGNKEKTIIDCCVSCFREHAVPALVAAGFQVRTEDLDW